MIIGACSRFVKDIARSLLNIKFLETLASDFSSRKHPEYKNLDFKEQKVSYGTDYSDKTFYVIRRPNDWGLMGITVIFLNQISYALRRGWIPVIDMCNYRSLYQTEDNLHKVNVWENYFEQPCGFSLSAISKAKNVVLSGMNVLSCKKYSISPQDRDLEFGSEKMTYWHNIMKNYIRLNKKTSDFIDEKYNTIFDKTNEKTLACFVRGTDYVELKPKNHPVQPTAREVIEEAKKLIAKGEYKRLYLVTEDQRVLDQFIAEFGSLVLYLDCERFGASYKKDRYIYDQDFFDRENDAFLRGLEYLTGIILLTKCEALIGGLASGLTAGIIWRGGYPYTHIWDLGIYK